MSPITLAAVARKLDNCEVENYDHKPFIPLCALKTLFTRTTIEELLKAHKIEIYLHSEIINAVLRGGLRVFATLTTVGDIEAITRFLKAGHSSRGGFDSKLPLYENTLESLKLPNPDTGKQFFKKQWRFLAPVLRDDQSHRELDDRTILPFLSFTPRGRGGFSNVYDVCVESSHHQIHGAGHEVKLICKQITRGVNENSLEVDFDHELHILSSLRLLKHPNIIKLISAYTKGPTYNFLLPAAEGDLKNLLSSSSACQGFGTNEEIIASLWGLSSAIQAVHNYAPNDFSIRMVGCHYDIKPRNILCENGRLLLSDFGLSRLRNEDDGSRTLFKKGEGCYLAPECEPSDQNFKPGKIGRASDMWSFGCVLAEILAYVSADPGDGPARVGRFYDARRIKLGPHIGYNFHDVHDINPAVTVFLNEIVEQHPKQEVGFLACLVKEILQFESQNRPEAWQTTQCLFHLAERHTFDAILETLESCVGSPIGFELKIEIHRLEIWGESFGLTSDPSCQNRLPWWSVSHSYSEYQKIHDILHSCQLEAIFIAEKLERINNPAYHLCYNLQRLQDMLWDMQSTAVRQELTNKMEETLLAMASPQKLQKIQHLLGYDDEIPRNDMAITSEGCNYRRVAYLATMREISNAMVQQSSSIQDFSVDKSLFGPPVVKLRNHCVKSALNTGGRVLIENVRYEAAWISRANELLERINAIASLRSRGITSDLFPVLKCKGYYHDAFRFEFGIVYELPQFANNTDPMDLVEIIKATQSRIKQPSLSQKFKLASTLVSHILSFHTGGWLHKNICSFNILCFPEIYKTLAESLSSPYFVGLNHSRLNDENAYSVLSGAEKDYQHPEYLRNSTRYTDDPQVPVRRFRQEFDYYSIGIVMIEIAFWKPIEAVMRRLVGSPEEVLEQLLETHIGIVKTYMGDTYGQCVESCLTSYVEDHRPLEEVREEFNSKVVIPLSQCSL